MTATAPTAPEERTANSAVSPDARQLWRRSRGPLLAVAVLLVGGLLVALLRAGDDGLLHPRAATPLGSRAVVELLADEGVETTLATTVEEAASAAGPDTTLLVALPDALAPGQQAALHRAAADSGGRTVLVSPGPGALSALAPGVAAAEPVEAEERDAGCSLSEARRAGSATLGGLRFRMPDGGTGCYPADGLPTLAALPSGDGDTVLLGAPDPLLNENLAEHGNAALTLQLLGTRDNLVWLLPSLDDLPAAEDERSLRELAHPGWTWGAAQLALAAALAAVWRARRLGPVVTEELPVTVRAAETTEGRARLYHRAGARDRAADALRAATRHRIAPLVGVAREAYADDPETLPHAVAARTGDPVADIRALLFGSSPADDAALVRLTERLDALEQRLSPGT